MTEFLNMGGYASYIWPAYGSALLILAGVTLTLVRRNAQVRAELVRIEARTARRKENVR